MTYPIRHEMSCIRVCPVFTRLLYIVCTAFHVACTESVVSWMCKDQCTFGVPYTKSVKDQCTVCLRICTRACTVCMCTDGILICTECISVYSDGILTYTKCWCADGILMCTDCKCTDGILTNTGILKCTVYCVQIVE